MAGVEEVTDVWAIAGEIDAELEGVFGCEFEDTDRDTLVMTALRPPSTDTSSWP